MSSPPGWREMVAQGLSQREVARPWYFPADNLGLAAKRLVVVRLPGLYGVVQHASSQRNSLPAIQEQWLPR
uniref:Uncharacterized protein n=1 Tax=Halomonas elongata TaxID=2746 RepID=Q9X744_HALEL|nr:hypothetical protein [Halomonas elongata]